MSKSTDSKAVIKQLLSIEGLKIECPHCEEASHVKRLKLFGMYDAEYPPVAHRLIEEKIESANASLTGSKERVKQLAVDKKKKPEKITSSTESTNFGQIGEQILPSFINFPYRQQDCRGLFKPVDYLVFENLHRKGVVDAIKFVDVKTGNARLTKNQKLIKQCVDSKNITHEVI